MKIVILCFWVILTRIGYYFLIQGTHSGLYYIQMSNLKDISQFIAIAVFLFLYYDRQLPIKIKRVIIFAIVYCLSFACVMLYPFMSNDLRAISESFLFAYNVFWAYILAALFLYTVFNSDKFSTKRA
jgi:hypothetical protein